MWVGPDGRSVLAAFNPGSYNGSITTDLSKPLAPLPPNPAIDNVAKQMGELQQGLQASQRDHHPLDPKQLQQFYELRSEQSALTAAQQERAAQRYQGDWAQRVLNNGKATGLLTDYHYYGTGDIGGAPDEESVQRLEAIVTAGSTELPPDNGMRFRRGQKHPDWPTVKVGAGPVHVVSATADQMFRDITPSEAATLPRYTGELELTNHSAGSLTSQAYQKRWIRKEELLADAAEKSSVAASWLGARTYPIERLNNAWTLAMAAHFHDLAAGTATPRAYEFAWNDDVIAMNQFADVLKSATQGVAAGLNTEGKGEPVVVFNPLNIARQDVVEAKIDFPGGVPKAVRVIAADGKEVPSQSSNGRVVFEASVPSVGYAVYQVEPVSTAGAASSELHITKNELENTYYRVTLNEDGDVASIFDKQIGRELLSAPARLAISYDNPTQWPAWNMDWEQEQAAPKAYVSRPAKIRIAEDGPVRVALEVTRETAGSRFVQTISLSAGDAGKRVEFGNVIDWKTRESNLKATFPLAAANEMATYNWDVGTIERPTAQPKKFEVPSHQWIDLTDMSGKFGTTILTDSKNGSDKPNDRTIRLTLIRTPGTAGGYADQGTQDIGHHEFTYGLAGHADGWRDAQTDWQALRLNAPLIAFSSAKHTGALGRSISLVKVSSPRVRIMALKKAENSDEVILRLVELDGKPQSDVRISFAAPIVAAREVNGQEQPLGPAHLNAGALQTSFSAYQPRAFALKLGSSRTRLASVRSTPVRLQYDAATATHDGDHSTAGFDGKGNTLPAELLPSRISFDDVGFELAAAKTGAPNAVIAKGQTIDLPAGDYDRVYLLAASTDGDQKAAFRVGSNSTELNIEDWGGFIGQWDDRIWSSTDTAHGNYGEMTGLKPGFIKRADLAWYGSHHHDTDGKNVAYAYSYLFGYRMVLPPGAKTLQLPNNDKIRILAVSLVEENPETHPAQPLYDVLPSPNAGAPDFTISAAPSASVPQGRSVSSRVLIMPRGSFEGNVHLTATGVPEGVTADFSPAAATGTSVLTLTAAKSAPKATSAITISAASGSIAHNATLPVSVTPVLSGTVPVDLSSAFNVTGIYKDGTKFPPPDGLDGDGYALSEETLGSEQVGSEVAFKLGPAGAPDVVTGKTVQLPPGRFASLKLLALAVNGDKEMQNFTVNYTDGTSAPFTQSLSDWAGAGNPPGESVAVTMPYRLVADGSTDANPFNLCAYSFALDKSKQVRSITLPGERDVLVFAITLVPVAK